MNGVGAAFRTSGWLIQSLFSSSDMPLPHSVSFHTNADNTLMCSLVPVSYPLTDCPGLECETELFKEHALIRHSLRSQALSPILGSIRNMNNGVFKPPLPLSPYKMKSGLLNTAFEDILGTTLTAPLWLLGLGCASAALRILLDSSLPLHSLTSMPWPKLLIQFSVCSLLEMASY